MLSQEKNELLTRVGPGTAMGQLLRRYWHPIAPVGELQENPVKAVRLLGEDLVLYYDGRGDYGLLGRHCPHRGADLSYGWVEDSGIRCMYHGWLFDRTGSCLQQPYEDAIDPGSGFRAKVKATAYHTAVLGGLIWAYLGPSPVPLVPNFEPFAWPNGFVQITLSEVPCNWFQCQENSIDPVHFEWLHRNWTAVQKGGDSRSYGPTHVGLAFEEFEYGFVCRRHTMDRDPGSEELICLWPNGLFSGSHFEWRVPVDDTATLIVTWWYLPRPADADGLAQDPVPYWYGPIQDPDTGRWITTHIMNQDIAAWLGQGTTADRTQERLGRSDAGVVLMRQRFLSELDRVSCGDDPKGLVRDPAANRCIPLPLAAKESSSAPGQAFSPTAPQQPRLPFQAGQPPHVRRAYERAMGSLTE
jgi:5,5'-dehydrodivanillate O-demethylase